MAVISVELKKRIKHSVPGWLFTLPLTLGLLIFTFIPVIQSLYYSFFEYDGLITFNFVGFKNYVNMFTIDADFWLVMGNTFIYAICSVALGMILSYLLAILVNRDTPGIQVFRVLYYLPVVIPAVVAGSLWLELYGYPDGAFNSILSALGLSAFPFFSMPGTSMFSLILMGVWSIGGGMILWLAALKNIPKTLYEAAEIDGANKLQCFFVITIPMSTPMIFYNLVVSIIGALQFNGTLIYAPMNGTGYDNSLYLIAVKIYKTAFESLSMGYACAIAWILFLIIGVLVAVIFKTSRWVFYGDE